MTYALELSERALGLQNRLVICLAQQRVEDVQHAKRAGHDRGNHIARIRPTGNFDPAFVPNKREHIVLAQLMQTQLGIVAVGRKVLQRVKRRPEVSERVLPGA